MTTGDTDDIIQRQKSVLPPWFPDLANAPVLGALLTGAGDAFSFVYTYLQQAAAETRIETATGGFLDLIGWDFFAANFLRRTGEADGSYAPRIQAEILRPRQTRLALTIMLTQLTGNAPIIQEAWNTGDFGTYSTGTMAFGAGLGWGSLAYNDQVFIQAFRPSSAGVPNVSGWGMVGGGYGVGAFSYIDMSQVTGLLTDDEIYQRIQQTIAAGCIAWVDIQNGRTVNPLIPQMIFGLANNAIELTLL